MISDCCQMEDQFFDALSGSILNLFDFNAERLRP
jgi:hypothetical protein